MIRKALGICASFERWEREIDIRSAVMVLAFSSVMGTGFPSVFITDRGWKEEYLLRVTVVVAVGGSNVMFRKAVARGSLSCCVDSGDCCR